MTAVHGRHTVIMIDGVDISQHCNTSNIEKNAPAHQTTGYGAGDHTYAGGVRDSKFTCGGTYDSDQTTGPGVVLDDRVGETVEIVRRLEGTGSGKPEQTFQAVITKYTESSPVDDMVAWTAEFQISGPVVKTTQA